MKENWKSDIFLYDLPIERIAQRPVSPPESAKLLLVSGSRETIHEASFAQIAEYFKPRDLLIFNDTKVIPARFFGRLPSGGEVELLLLKRLSADGSKWLSTGRPLKKFGPGLEIKIDDSLSAIVIDRSGPRELIIEFRMQGEGTDLPRILDTKGTMPIPPYIRKGRGDEQDRKDYQTIFSRLEGSVAAPTASLHFTDSLVAAIQDRGVELGFVTLHVGPPSFLSVIEEGQAGSTTVSPPGFETYYYDQKIVDAITRTRMCGGRVIAVGTTVVRALESMVRAASTNEPIKTDLFIYPGFKFKAIDAMITNFHQPGSSHLLLVQAFLGRRMLERSYEYALNFDFRFLSYGDGMLIS